MERGIFEIVDTESLVPAEHLLRKIDAAVDFNRIYDMVEPLYCTDNGRTSVDPVVLFKMVLIQHIYGLTSLRRTAEEVSMNMAYRWFPGYRLNEPTPHFSTLSFNFRHHFTSETVDQIFAWILNELVETGYVAPGVVFVDGTHIKANANLKKTVKKEVPIAAKRYAKELMDEVNADREAHGKLPFEDNDDGSSRVLLKVDSDSYFYGEAVKDLKLYTGYVYTGAVVLPEKCLYQKNMGDDQPWYIRQVTEDGYFIEELEVQRGYSNGDLVCVTGIEEGTFYDNGYQVIAEG